MTGRSPLLKNGLTIKQDKFVKGMMENLQKTGELKATDVAFDVYDAKTRHVADSIASENLGKPAIKEALHLALEKSGVTLDHLAPALAGLTQAIPKDISADVKLRAIVESFKLLGAYPNTKQPISSTSTVINIQNIGYSEAKERMKELHGESSELMGDD